MPGLDSKVITLLHFYGPNNGICFPELSGKHKWDVAGTLVVSTAKYRFPPSSGLFDGAGYLLSADHADWALGTSEWTIDFFFNTTMAGEGFIYYQGNNVGDAATVALFIRMNGTKLDFCPDFSAYPSHHLIISTNAVNDGVWHHAACLRQGTIFKMYIDGILTGTPWDGGAYSMIDSGSSAFIGKMGATYSGYIGNLAEFRFSTGVARWTANFVPPVAPYGLGLQSYLIAKRNRFRATGVSLG